MMTACPPDDMPRCLVCGGRNAAAYELGVAAHHFCPPHAINPIPVVIA